VADVERHAAGGQADVLDLAGDREGQVAPLAVSSFTL
jgi:hypothetical protein